MCWSTRCSSTWRISSSSSSCGDSGVIGVTPAFSSCSASTELPNSYSTIRYFSIATPLCEDHVRQS